MWGGPFRAAITPRNQNTKHELKVSDKAFVVSWFRDFRSWFSRRQNVALAANGMIITTITNYSEPDNILHDLSYCFLKVRAT